MSEGYGFSRRASSRSTASRMNDASLFGPSSASIRAIVSAGKRTVVGRTPRGGRPIRAPLTATVFPAKAISFPQPVIDGISATAYISAIGNGGKDMTDIAGPYAVNITADGEHQVCGRHGRIIRRYPAAMASAADADCRKLQAGFTKRERQVRDAAPELLAALEWLHLGKGAPVDVAALIARINSQVPA